ncbi:hypothetical protein DRN67_04215 [Candidatus Micrarchaeota archaeon]|nr:MAG: hypothetical protein DRN67_04215 [Candidatus Micrarchaeota archaeon]
MVRFNPLARQALEKGEIEVRVRRSGVFQKLDLELKRFPAGGAQYVALCTDKIIDVGELVRVAEEVGLPVFARNGKVFPRGKRASDFVGL